jgi:4'-phosphopantetheinyl transferase EntD
VDESTQYVISRLREWFGDSAGISARVIDGICPLFPAEEECMRSAVQKRREEFSTGRWCARQALFELGVSPTPILVGVRREPLWPSGIVGSITHAAGLSAAVAGRIERWPGVGIDILDASAAGQILRDAARLIADEVEESSAREALRADVDPRALLFSAKESVIKAISERAQRFVDFTEIRLTLQDAYFVAECPPQVGAGVRGWWSATEQLILTSAMVPV